MFNLTWIQLLKLSMALAIVKDLLVADSTRFAIYNEALKRFCSEFEVDMQGKSVSNFQGLVQFIDKNFFSEYESQIVNILDLEASKRIHELVPLIMEEYIARLLRDIDNFQQAKQINQYIEAFEIQKRHLQLHQNQIQNLPQKEAMFAYIFRIFPVVLIFFNGK